MIVAAATFLLVLAVFLGIYWLLLVRPEQRDQAALRQRLRVKREPRTVKTSLRKTAQRLSAIPAMDGALSRSRRLVGPLSRLIEQADARMTVATLLLTCGLAALATAYVGLQVTGQLLLALPVGALAGWVPITYLQWKRSRRLLAFEEQFPEALDLLSRALKAGHAFTTGIAMVADEMAKPVGPEFRVLYDQQNYGMPMPEALRAFAERVPVLDAKFFVTAVMIQREAGGNLSEVLENLASVIRDRFRVKRQIRVISAHGRLTGLVLTAVPPSLAFALFAISPEHWSVLLNDSLGVRLVLLALFLQITGGLIIRKLVRIEY